MPASAQTVAVEGARERGHGWMFRNEGICYVIVPRHVIEGSPRVTVTSAAPMSTGTGDSILPFFPGFDLGIVRVRGGIEARCVEDVAKLDLDEAARGTRRAQLERLVAGGQLDRTPIRIEDFGYHSFSGIIEEDAAAVIRQGTSGAFAFVGDTPVGMAYRSAGETSAVFLRADEIHMHINRFLSEQGSALSDLGAAGGSSAPASEGTLALSLREVTLPPVAPDFAPENMLGDGRYLFAPSGRAALLFEIGGEAPAALARILITTQPESGVALPKDVLVEISPKPDGERFFRLGQFRTGPDGVLDTGTIAPRLARLVRLTILNTWGEGPVGVDRVEMFGG